MMPKLTQQEINDLLTCFNTHNHDDHRVNGLRLLEIIQAIRDKLRRDEDSRDICLDLMDMLDVPQR